MWFAILFFNWQPALSLESEKKKKKKKKKIIISSVEYPFLDLESTRYDFLIQPICSLRLTYI